MALTSPKQLSFWQEFDAALFDLDGVVYRGPNPVAHAPESITQLRSLDVPIVFVTNNASRTPEQVAQHLSELGVPTTAAQVRTAAQAAAAYVAEQHAGANVLMIGGLGLELALEEAGLTLVDSADDKPDFVVQGFAPDVAWPDLAEGVYAINSGSRFVASNLDLTLPTERGMAPGNGSLVGVVQAATGVEPVSTGKPAAAIFHQSALQAKSERPLVVGDRLDTDIKGANAAGMASVHVLTGVDDARGVINAPKELRPTYLIDDLRGLNEPYELATQNSDGHWECGSWTAIITETDILLQTSGQEPITLAQLSTDSGVCRLNLSQYRSLVHGSWAQLDSRHSLPQVPVIEVVRNV